MGTVKRMTCVNKSVTLLVCLPVAKQRSGHSAPCMSGFQLNITYVSFSLYFLMLTLSNLGILMDGLLLLKDY